MPETVFDDPLFLLCFTPDGVQVVRRDLDDGPVVFSHIQYASSVPVLIPAWDLCSTVPLSVFVSSCRRIVCRPPIDKWRARMTNATHRRNPSPRKQIISRYIASADLVSVTDPGRRVWPVPLPARGAAGPPCHACQATVSRQQTQGPPVILDQWTHLHTHLSTVLSHGETRGKKRKRKKKRGRASSSWVVDDLILNEWMGLNSLI